MFSVYIGMLTLTYIAGLAINISFFIYLFGQALKPIFMLSEFEIDPSTHVWRISSKGFCLQLRESENKWRTYIHNIRIRTTELCFGAALNCCSRWLYNLLGILSIKTLEL